MARRKKRENPRGVALVTGGAVRIGRAICLGLAESGFDIAVHCHRSTRAATELVKQLGRQGVRASAFSKDLSADDAGELVGAVEAEFGRVTLLVNSAAAFIREPFPETKLHTLDSQWALNARAPFLLSQALARASRHRTDAHIINVLDVGGAFNVWRNYSAYCMTKAALKALTECLALELAPQVRVNAVAPGTVLPPTHLSEAALETLRARIPQRRFGSPFDVAAAVRFLADGPRFVTGHTLVVDGGRRLETGARE